MHLKSVAMGSDKPIIYKSFLIRIWRDEAGSQRRIMVIQLDASDRQYYFANLDDLMMFLLQEMEKLS